MRELIIDEKKQYGRISPELHSQFLEVLGACVYGGVWVGEDSEIPNIRGIRKAFVDAMRELAPPLIRWPGGCYADTYHWRDGIGERAKRPVSFNENFATYETDCHAFGTHEFMDLCRMVGAKPWLNVNMLSGSVQEMKDWMEYCNREDPTDLMREREANGSAEAFHVEYWGIGNEPWGGGGYYTAAGYVNEYRKYVTAAPTFQKSITEPSPQPMRMIIAGPDGNKPTERKTWTRDLFRELGKYRCPRLDALDLHFYNWNVLHPEDTDTSFDEDGWYRVLDGCMELEDVIREQSALIEEGLAALPQPEGFFDEGQKTCRLFIGEWGNWHGSAFTARPALFQQVTMRDALTTALTLDIFHRNCARVAAACVAQTVNVLNALFLTKGERFVRTPNYDVFRMYQVHRGGICIDASLSKRDGTGREMLFAAASVKENVISVNVVNISMDSPCTILLRLSGGYDFLDGQTLSSGHPDDCNTWEDPDRIRAGKCRTPKRTADGFELSLRPASVNVFRFRKKADASAVSRKDGCGDHVTM